MKKNFFKYLVIIVFSFLIFKTYCSVSETEQEPESILLAVLKSELKAARIKAKNAIEKSKAMTESITEAIKELKRVSEAKEPSEEALLNLRKKEEIVANLTEEINKSIVTIKEIKEKIEAEKVDAAFKIEEDRLIKINQEAKQKLQSKILTNKWLTIKDKIELDSLWTEYDDVIEEQWKENKILEEQILEDEKYSVSRFLTLKQKTYLGDKASMFVELILKENIPSLRLYKKDFWSKVKQWLSSFSNQKEIIKARKLATQLLEQTMQDFDSFMTYSKSYENKRIESEKQNLKKITTLKKELENVLEEKSTDTQTEVELEKVLKKRLIDTQAEAQVEKIKGRKEQLEKVSNLKQKAIANKAAFDAKETKNRLAVLERKVQLARAQYAQDKAEESLKAFQSARKPVPVLVKSIPKSKK